MLNIRKLSKSQKIVAVIIAAVIVVLFGLIGAKIVSDKKAQAYETELNSYIDKLTGAGNDQLLSSFSADVPKISGGLGFVSNKYKLAGRAKTRHGRLYHELSHQNRGTVLPYELKTASEMLLFKSF